ncbi:uncharacterized protein LOC126896273 [Daktulosphaira vitifoliae]|uniref:uncharacterized protein LOC126896273 n=1 Tax=Daktulosphaira vitifoliae TaxID=58002 RepID=UPI0021AA6C0C|nr:uncharacterized protein LOC126896273 [Daktulosphaira vitifoliae]
MCFYIFIVMYLTSSFTNGLLYSSYPFNEEGELNDGASSYLEDLFRNNNKSTEGMSYYEFQYLLKSYNWLYNMDDSEIEKLFSDGVNDIFSSLSTRLYEN